MQKVGILSRWSVTIRRLKLREQIPALLMKAFDYLPMEVFDANPQDGSGDLPLSCMSVRHGIHLSVRKSPVIFMTEMVISDFPISKKDHDAPKKPLRVTASGGHVRRVKKSTGVAGKPSPFKIDQGSHAPGN
jgi:hypothetical protein